MTGTLKDIQKDIFKGEFVAAFYVGKTLPNSLQQLEGEKLSIDVKKWRKGRSRDANAYFHALCTELAEHFGLTLDHIKQQMVIKYGTVARDEQGAKVGCKIPASANIEDYYPYVRCFDKREENGVLFNCYIFYKRTRELNSKEMARLIDGVVSECKEQGIETLPPDELAKLCERRK